MAALGEKTAPTVQEEEPRAPTVEAHIAGARILLVEDNDINQEVAREILLGAGLKVETASYNFV